MFSPVIRNKDNNINKTINTVKAMANHMPKGKIKILKSVYKQSIILLDIKQAYNDKSQILKLFS